MREEKVNIISDDILNTACAVCFTSNGVLNKHGKLVMGAGVAKVFRDKWPELAETAGWWVKKRGNKVTILRRMQRPNDDTIYCFGSEPPEDKVFYILNFPTKHHYRDPSDLELIKRSANELMKIVEGGGLKNVYLPRPGCGLGGLDWESEVKPLLSQVFDDRIIIVSN